MMLDLDAGEIRELAREAAGNWRRFESFAWHEKPDSPDDWTVYHLDHRDSRLLGQSNAAAVRREFGRFLAAGVNARAEHFRHWAVGWIDALSIRVFDKRGRTTDAFRRLVGIIQRLEDYPLLDEVDYCNREYDATIAGIIDSARWNASTSLDEDQAVEVYHFLSLNYPEAIENHDDTGGYPNEEQIREALEVLDMLETED